MLLRARKLDTLVSDDRFFSSLYRGETKLAKFATNCHGTRRRRNSCSHMPMYNLSSRNREGEIGCKSKGNAEPRRMQRDSLLAYIAIGQFDHVVFRSRCTRRGSIRLFYIPLIISSFFSSYCLFLTFPFVPPTHDPHYHPD